MVTAGTRDDALVHHILLSFFCQPDPVDRGH
jgi:hypothetical protein